MQSKSQKLFYGPQLSALAVVSVRRLAWALGSSMSAAVDHMVQFLPSMVDPAEVCPSCRDPSRCTACIFWCQSAAPKTAAVQAVQ